MEVLNSLPKHNLFGLERQDYKSARVAVLPVPYDSTVTYKAGTRDGPRAIIEASRNMEWYSYELGRDVGSEIGIFTLDELAPDLSSPENMVNRISKEVGLLLDDKKIPLILGGEHTVSIGAFKAVKERHKDVGVVQLDAHSDTRDTMFNSRYAHSNVMARGVELFGSYCNVGVRSIEEKSPDALKKGRIVFMNEVKAKGARKLAAEIAKSMPKRLYLTIDLDVLDPSEMPSVGTPEPGGMRFGELCELLDELSKTKELVGMDVVELCPIPGMHAPDYLAAKLIYLSLGYFIAK